MPIQPCSYDYALHIFCRGMLPPELRRKVLSHLLEWEKENLALALLETRQIVLPSIDDFGLHFTRQVQLTWRQRLGEIVENSIVQLESNDCDIVYHIVTRTHLREGQSVMDIMMSGAAVH